MLTWYVADFVTGDFVERVPFRTSGLQRTIGARSSISVELDVNDPSVPPGWDQVIDPVRSLIVPVDGDTPLGGFMVEDGADIGDPTTALALVSLEAVPESFYCVEGTYYGEQTERTFTETDDEADVAAWLLAEAITGCGFELSVAQTGKGGDHTYSYYEDRTVASALSDLASQEQGVEWVTRVRWADQTHRRFIKTIEIGPKVGRDMTETVFRNRHLTKRVRNRSWAKRAIRTTATGDGVGDSRPMSKPVIDQAAIDAGVPPWQLRVPAPSIDDEAGLDRIAAAAGSRYRNGTGSWELSLSQTDEWAPRIVSGFDVGDRVQMSLDPTEDDPASWYGTARVIGWRATVVDHVITEATPVMWDPEEDA